MDESSLPDIAQLLSGSIGASTRAATCTAVAACSSGEAGATLRHLIGTTQAGETIIRRLLLLCGDPQCSRLALSALVNLSEDEEASAVMTRAGAVDRATQALLDDDQRNLASLYSGLLSNLTRFPNGVDGLVGKGKGEKASMQSINTLFKLVARIDRIPNVLWMSNACSTPEGRAALLLKGDAAKADTVAADPNLVDNSKQPLTWLLRLLVSDSEPTRLAAASALRNCAMAEDCHLALIRQTNAVGTCLVRLMSVSRPIRLQQVKSAPDEVKTVAADPTSAKPEPLVEIRLLLVESLLLLCKTRAGRDALRELSVYEVLDEWKELEDNQQIRQAVESTLDRLVVAEDDEEETLTAADLANGTSIVETVGAK